MYNIRKNNTKNIFAEVAMLTEQACAKINLGLKVLGKRADGYHELDMVMQTISWCDTLRFVHAPEIVLEFENSSSLQQDTEENLIIRAARLLKEHTGYTGGARISLTKRIPIAAGLAGGSADAAATLRGLNKLWCTGLDFAELESLAARLGSDIPFCVRGGTQRCRGRGEILQPLVHNHDWQLLVFKPDFAVSTAAVYKSFALDKVEKSSDIEGLIAVLTEKSEGLPELLANDLESVTLAMRPELVSIKTKMLNYGAQAVLMSGSGPSIFAVVRDKQQAETILQIVLAEYPGEGKYARFVAAVSE